MAKISAKNCSFSNRRPLSCCRWEHFLRETCLWNDFSCWIYLTPPNLCVYKPWNLVNYKLGNWVWSFFTLFLSRVCDLMASPPHICMLSVWRHWSKEKGKTITFSPFVYSLSWWCGGEGGFEFYNGHDAVINLFLPNDEGEVSWSLSRRRVAVGCGFATSRNW